MKNIQIEGKLFRSPLSWLILAISFVGVFIAGWLLPLRLFVGSAMLALIVSSVVLIRMFVVPRDSKSDLPLLPLQISVCVCIVSFLCVIEKGFAYSFIGEPFLPFWEISLILGLIIGCFVMIKWGWKGAKWFGRIGGILGLTLVTAIFVIIFASHLNFLLDFHEPVECTARIEEKDIDDNRKYPDTYNFRMTVNGETFDLDVGLIEYEKYEVGDTYTFEKYQGAFGKSFYISD